MTNLLKCAETLKDVRRCMQNDADPRMMAALEEVITKIEHCTAEDEGTPWRLAQAAGEGLVVIGEILMCLNGIADIVTRFRA